MPPDPEYAGFDGVARSKRPYTLHDIRKATLWGTLLAGGAGVEYHFGYRLPQSDLVCEDFRSRDRSWDYCRIALEFFCEHQIPFWRMENADELVGNPGHDNSRYCFALPGEWYLVYLPEGGAATLDVSGTLKETRFSVAWFNPREGGALLPAVAVAGGGTVELRAPDVNDWLAVVKRR